jgi:hypothetical protein
MIEFIGPLYNWLQLFTNHYLTIIFFRLGTPWELFWSLPTELRCTLLYSLSSDLNYEVKSHCDWRSVNQSVGQSWCRAPSAANDQIYITVWQLRSCFFGQPHWREDESVFCQFLLNYDWPCPLVTPWHEPQRKHCLLLSIMHIYWSIT